MEFTTGSDLDWILLVDGQADATNQRTYLEIHRAIRESSRLRRAGREGTFEKLVFSQPIIHRIGGEEDSNSNTTRRILLLLEALPIGERLAFERVRKGILRRYLDEDRGLFQTDLNERTRWIPLFLLNDLTRYWRTMAVDFAYKQFERGNGGYALRSIKLGISRKLMFASGLLACFWCDPEISRVSGQEPHAHSLIRCLMEFLALTPLERLALFFSTHRHSNEKPFLEQSAVELFNAYDEFVGLLNVPENRERLENLRREDEKTDETFQRARSIRTRFKEAIQNTFLDQRSPLYRLTIEKGVF
jgi:hypothetical protein